MSLDPSVTVLAICHNDSATLVAALGACLAQTIPGQPADVVVVDMASSDLSVAMVREHFPQLTVLACSEPNYAAAVNAGIAATGGDYVALVDCRTALEPDWLAQLLPAIEGQEAVGAVHGTLLAADGVRLASEIWQPDQPAGSIERFPLLFSRHCSNQVGSWDEQLLCALEHSDFILRCQQQGFAPRRVAGAVAQRLPQSAADSREQRYLAARNQLYLTAKHSPRALVQALETSTFYAAGEFDNLYRALLFAVRAFCREHTVAQARVLLRELADSLPQILGDISSRNFFSHLELQLGLRRIRVGIYDHAGHFAGGGQRYMADLAALIQDRYDVTYLFNKDVSLDKYADWYDIDLSRCKSRIIPIPFFEERNWYTPDEAMVSPLKNNVFDVVSAQTLDYDIFINTNMLGKVNPLALQSIFICHFPDRYPDHYFQVPKYDHLVVSGEYSRQWVRKRWNLEPTFKLYPPVNMVGEHSSPDHKDKIILSVSRFEVTRSKKQLEMVKAFKALCRAHPEASAGWKLILAGGSTPQNPYLDIVRNEAAGADGTIEIRANAAFSEICDLYRRARIFWHACGLNEKRPERVEHFGMTTVEAMQNYCVPIVIDGGGQREIVEDGKSGFRFSSVTALCEHSVRVMCDETLSREIAVAAYERSQRFSHDVFRQKLEELLAVVERELLGQEVLQDGQPQDSAWQPGS
jgi:glycosyltransferase involved in cell wall biosynthesis